VQGTPLADVAPTPQNEPGDELHAPHTVAPLTAENVPTAQRLHTGAPALLNRPGWHWAVHVGTVSPAVSPKRPGAHCVHDAAFARLNVPTPHSCADDEGAPAGQKNPATEVQDKVQVAMDVAPVAVLPVLAGLQIIGDVHAEKFVCE
jgi:hypothetical protein